MSRAAAAVALAAFFLATAACTTPPGVSAEEAEQWLEERRADMPANALGSTEGRLSPDDPDPAPDDGVTLTFEETVGFAEIRLECLGEGTVSFAVHVTMVDHTVEQTYPDRTCGTDVHGSRYGPDVVSVRIDAFGADRDTAYHAVVLDSEA